MKTDERKGSHQTMSLFGDEPKIKPQPVFTTGRVEIFFDGGCLGNPGQKYGSFQVLFDGKQIAGRNRVEFGHGTNNEAEFNSLKLALDEAVAWLETKGIDLNTLSLAIETDSMIVRNRLHQHFFPWYRKIAERCHEAGRLFFMHSDGNLTTLIDDLIALGLDALHPIDPTAMDIVEVKRRWGHRLCLFGNVDTELLRSGTVDQVRARVGELLRQVAPGGGYGLGSGNSVPSWACLENYNAMRETVLQYGRYPIRLPASEARETGAVSDRARHHARAGGD
jgi:hypothetical protein